VERVRPFVRPSVRLSAGPVRLRATCSARCPSQVDCLACVRACVESRFAVPQSRPRRLSPSLQSRPLMILKWLARRRLDLLSIPARTRARSHACVHRIQSGRLQRLRGGHICSAGTRAAPADVKTNDICARCHHVFATPFDIPRPILFREGKRPPVRICILCYDAL
jgi:hypothetical protein